MTLSTHARYLAVFVLLIAGTACAIVALTASNFYLHHTRYFFDAISEHQFNVSHQDADVVIIGDSSALFGVAPQQVKRQTGLNVYNLGVPMPTLMMDRDLLLSRYLEHNKRPRLLVLYLSATTRVSPPYNGHPVWYEGETMLLRYADARAAVAHFTSHPEQLSIFLMLAARHLGQMDWSGRSYQDVAATEDAENGYMPLPPGGALQRTDCPMWQIPPAADKQLIGDFRRKAAALGMRSAVYLAPIPDCDHTFAQVASIYRGLVDNVPYTLDRQLFAADNLLSHLRAPGAQRNTPIFSAFLTRLLRSDPRTADAR